MKKFEKYLWLLMSILALNGCSHAVVLISRKTGEKSYGTAYEGANTVEVVHRGKKYNGRYVFGGSSSTIILPTGASGGPMIGSTSGGSHGSVLAYSEDGSALRCEFQYNDNGLGLCRDSANALYDLLID